MPSSQRDPAGRRALLALCGAAALVLGAGCEPCRAQSFKDALGQAYLYNPQLAAGRASVRQMDEGVPRALSGWRPTVTVLGEVGKSVVSDSLAGPHPQQRIPQAALLTLQQPLYTGGRVSAQVDQAKALVLAQRAQLRATESSVLLAAGTAYLDVARDQRTVGLNRTNLALLDRTLRAAEQQYAVGDITLADVAQARARNADGRAQLAMAEAQLAASRATYEQQVGSPPGSLDMPRLDLKLPRSRDAAAAQAVAANFAVRSARETFAANAAGVDVVRAGLLPTISLTGVLSRLKETPVQMLH
jgi:outer membrane protein